MSYFKDTQSGELFIHLNKARLTTNPADKVVVYVQTKTGEVWAMPWDDYYGLLPNGDPRFQPVHEAEAKKQLRRERRRLMNG